YDRFRPSSLSLVNPYVSAWLLDASVGEYVVPVALRQQHRGFHGPPALYCFLSLVRLSGRGGTDPGESRFAHSYGRCVGCDQRRNGRLSPALPDGTRLHPRIPRLFRDLNGSTSLGDARLLVPNPIHQWVGVIR